MQRFKLRVLLAALWLTAVGCDANTDSALTQNTQQAASSNELLWLGENMASLTAAMNSKPAKAVAASFPTPSLPESLQPFYPQPNQRFERWTLSALTQTEDSDEWHWMEQQFVRIALTDEPRVDSLWAFRDVITHQLRGYDFQSKQSQSQQSIERRALSLSDVTQQLLTINDISVAFDHVDCRSTITLTHPSQSTRWDFTQCPQRVQVGDTVVATAFTPMHRGVGWVSHAYGQLPNFGGPVILEELTIVLSESQQLNVSRSRRRSGKGPETLTATLFSDDETTQVKDVRWQESFAEGAHYPTLITITLPTLSRTFTLDVPQGLSLNDTSTLLGVQHGVLVNTQDITQPMVPGLITLFPRQPEP